MPELRWKFRATANQACDCSRNASGIDPAGHAQRAMSEWSVYLVRCGDGTLYTGIATDVERRLREHREGIRGAKYLRGRAPLTLHFQYRVGSRSQACKVEHHIRNLAKADKEDCARLPGRIVDMLADS